MSTINLLNQYKIQEDNIAILIEEISNDLVYIIELINKNKILEGIELLLSKINDKFNMFTYLLNKELKYKVLIYGINDISLNVSKLINYDNTDLIFYVSNNLDYWNKHISGVYIVPLEEAVKYSYDYLIVADTDLDALNRKLLSGEINNEQIFNYMYYICNFGFYGSPEFFTQYHAFKKSEKTYEGIITGISYTQKGIKAELLPKRFFNLACASQDLFYDYEMIKHSLGFKKVNETIKYAIIGLCYYSFQYDLSKSDAGKYRSNYYYKVTNEYHNYDGSDKNKMFYKRFYEISKNILKSNHDDILYEMLEEKYIKIIEDGKTKEFDSSLLNDEEEGKCIKEVERKYNKNYPLTVEENKKIFKNYLDMLYTNDIKPIIIISPQTKLYQKNISIPIRDQFYEIIDEFQKEYDFQFLDYFYSDDFIDSDFYDVSHLNNKGSIKWTNLLSKDIKW